MEMKEGTEESHYVLDAGAHAFIVVDTVYVLRRSKDSTVRGGIDIVRNLRAE